ncbi:MAG: MoaD family protein [Deltaproteobacteria bacterium]|nr:MoaD family protein [Deltaproteobacteria bacterium]
MLIKYFADVRQLSGCEDQPWTKAAPTLRELLEGLGAQHGAGFRERVFSGQELSPTIIILVNGHHVAHLQGLQTKLGPEDTVAIFPMVAGG